MAEVTRKLVKKRAGHRGDLTLIIKSIDDCIERKQANMLSDLEGLKVVLLNKFSKLKGLDEEIYDKLADEQDISEEALIKAASGASDIETRVQIRLQSIERMILARIQPNGHEGGSVNGSSGSGSNQKVKLPKKELQRFSGDPQRWQAFWDTYDSLIHSNEELSEIDKFNYLRSVLSGEALNAIEGFSPTKENYKQLIEVLRDRFGKKAFIISSHMESILKLPDMSGAHNTKKLRRTYDK